MRGLVPIICALFFGLGLEAQHVDLIIQDQEGRPIAGALIIDYLGNEYGPSNLEGFIRFPYEGGSLVQVFKEGYYIRALELNWTEMTQSQRRITLERNDIKLQEVVVSAQKVPYTDSLRVRDFDLQDSNLLVLGFRYLVLSNLDFDLKWQSPNAQDYLSIERDPRGNLFLLSKDSASQVLIRADHIYFYPPVAKDQYNRYIKPLAAEMGESLILQNMNPEAMPLPVSPYRPGDRGKSMTFAPFHNQGVEFFIYRKGQKPERFYFSVDTNAVLLAHDAFMDAFNIAAGMERNYDLYGVWQHEKLFDLDQAQKIYRRAYAKEIRTPIFKQEDQYILFDRFADKVVCFDGQGKEIAQHPFHIDDDFIKPLIIQNRLDEHLYALKEKRGMVRLYPIKDYQLQGFQKVGLFARETKVHGSWLFFVDESNYLRRQKLSIP